MDMNRRTIASGAQAALLAAAWGCGASGGGPGYGLDVGSDEGGPGSFGSEVDSGTNATSALTAHIEQNHVTVTFVTVACHDSCADVEAVASGGTPPYAFAWDDGSTSATRQVCPAASTRYAVTVTDTGSTGELGQVAQTVRVPLVANVIACPEGGTDAGPPLDASILGHVVVPGTADIWLAGQPAGASLKDTTQPGQDLAPADAPVEIDVVAGITLTFSATGSTSFTGGFCSGPTPDGGCLLTVNGGPANGISSAQVPADALIGVFTGPGVPGGQAPVGLGLDTTFATLSPALDQVFFIGDGLTGTGTGATQAFLAPAGATRLFLAASDTLGTNYNNSGQFDVVVSAR
jgi:hypothetical protein